MIFVYLLDKSYIRVIYCLRGLIAIKHITAKIIKLGPGGNGGGRVANILILIGFTF